MKFIDETGNHYGKLTVIERDTSRKGSYWKCKCDCGNYIVARRDQLTRKNNPKKSCIECFKKEISKRSLKNETGNKYGYLTVLYRVENLLKKEGKWHCKCDCGNECDVIGSHLRNGTTQSCGCKKFESHNAIDETGKRYGNLIVIEPVGKKDGTHIFWKCKCDCGNIVEVNGSYLRNGATRSCGCLKSKKEKEITELLINNNILFKKEYSIPGLTGTKNGLLRFDFAIFNNDGTISHLLEYDGIQHFKKVDWFDSTQDFKDRVENDKRKNEYCKNNNIKLIRINYKEEISLDKIMGRRDAQNGER